MSQSYRNRRATSIENDSVRVTVLQEGGHIAEVFDKRAGVNPLWTPPWPSIEPSAYNPTAHPEYGDVVEAPLLAGIMGHNLCLDLFGPPSPAELAAGLPAHGEMSLARCDVSVTDRTLITKAALPSAQLRFERRIQLHDRAVRIDEFVENMTQTDRPIAWTQHVTFGPPFLEQGATEFSTSAAQGRVFETAFGADDYLQPAADFVWPLAPLKSGGSHDLRKTPAVPKSGGFTTQLMKPDLENAFFAAFAPSFQLTIAYVWKRGDFPWLGIWEENHSRAQPPWNGRTLTRGMEFGVSPFPEPRRAMITRNSLFGVPAYRWVPAKTTINVQYWIVIQETQTVPEVFDWPGSSE